MVEPPVQTRDVVSFGPFSLFVSERALVREGVTVQLGARALDMLIALVSRPNKPMDKRDLIALVWPDVTVEESSLRFHIANLRKVLGDGKDGARYITTLAGRGYCFVAPVSRSSDKTPASAAVATVVSHTSLPNRLTRMVGRADSILMVSTQLTATRFVTIVGAGGVGKTTIAVAVGHELMDAFGGAVLFVDLGALSDPKLTAMSLASMLGLSVQSADPTPGLIAHLRDKRILLILDNCEHLIDAAAALAEHICAAAPKVHILATSREPLRVEGEHVYRLAPLAFPPDDAELTVAVALTFSAVQLFVERAAASGAQLELNDSNVAMVAGICRKLDGIALAIALAAGRVYTFGLQQTAALLEERLSLLWQGQRTAPPRQQTLKATLDWSYGLLSELEKQVLRQLALFVGNFTLEAARAVLANSSMDQVGVVGAIDGLIAKSLIASDGSAPAGRWRLLQSIRTYALERLGEGDEAAQAARSHALFFRDLVASAAPAKRSDTMLSSLTLCSREIDNVRAALDWAFSRTGDVEIGIALTAAYVPVWLHFAWHVECVERTECAFDALGPDSNTDLSLRMQLRCGLGLALLQTMGPPERIATILTGAFQLAEDLGDVDAQLRTLWALWLLHHDTGNCRAALRMTDQFATAARSADDPAVELVADRLSGYTLQFGGDLATAQWRIERVLKLYEAPVDRRHRFWFLHDQRVAARDLLARSLWLQGFVDQAAEHARACLEAAEATGNSLSICEALRLAMCPIALATGDLFTAEHAVAKLIDHATRRNATYWAIVARCLEGELLIKRGELEHGSVLLGDALGICEKTGWAVCYPGFKGALAEALIGLGHVAEALTAVEQALRAADRGGEHWSVAELLRIKGKCLFEGWGDTSESAAEDCFIGAIDVAKQQGALFWELRAATDLARLRIRQKRLQNAKEILAPVYGRFTEGFETSDLKAARSVLAHLG